MSLDNLLLENIKALKKPEFDEVVRLYLSEVYNYKRIINTDGKNDGGNDIRVFDIQGVRNQYQLTVQKSNFESKLNEDLDKAKKNHKNHGFSNSLIFFYSKPLTNVKRDELIRKALLNYGIILILIEAKQISQESAFDYPAIAELIFKLNKINITSSQKDVFGKDDEKYKMLYDLISFGSAVDIKGDLIKSYILHLLLIEKDELPKLEVYERIDKYFKTVGVKSYYDNIINNLSSNSKIKVTNNRIKLTDEEKERLENVIKKFELTENLFVISIEKKLKEKGINGKTKEVINALKKVYDTNYAVNIREIDTRDSDTTSFEKETKSFKKFLQKISNTKNVNELLEDLFSICESNDFIQKISAGNFFSKVTRPENMQRFASLYKSGLTQIYLDTQILLRSICVSFNPKLQFESPFLRSTRNLINYSEKNNLNLSTSKDYAYEVINHFKNALNLVPFTKFDKYQSLGKSKNVFFQFYEVLNENNFIDENVTYEGFLEILGFRYKSHNGSNNYFNKVKYLLNASGIEIIDFPRKYSIGDAVRFFEAKDGAGMNRKKKQQAVTYDSRMLEFLADDNVDVHPIDPIFITWDKTFFKVRKEYFKENRSCTKWFMFTPSKFISNHSLLNFEVEPECITTEILSILDEDSDFVQQTQSLLDSINSIINFDDEVGIEYINKLNNLRDKEIKRVDEQPEFPANASDKPDERPIVIDLIFFRLTNHFNKDKSLFDDYKNLFTNKEHLDSFINIISNEIDYYQANGKLNNKLISNISALVEKSNKTS
ncbi:hypothetical protein [Pontimicrobium sp. MEBiC06410]